MQKLLIIQAAALSERLASEHWSNELHDLTFQPLDSIFPALTCTAQASFRTASDVSEHGMVGNGFFYKDLMRPMFWEQSAALVNGARIWDTYRSSGKSVAVLFWQQSMGEAADMIISPAPIHKHHGGMIQSCYSKPAGLYDKLRTAVGRDFDLKHYWGPLASVKASDWITDAAIETISNPDIQPDLCLTYLPVLDYDLQRFGPASSQAAAAMADLQRELTSLIQAAGKHNYEVIIFGDYAIAQANRGAVLPNLALREAGLMATRSIKGRLYPDIHASKAFAVVDHEVAQVHVSDTDATDSVRDVLARTPGIERVLDNAQQAELHIDHGRSGDLVAVAEDGYWFAYPWWTDESEAPDYAAHVDIHNKPGYDPCELFMGKWIPPSICRDHSRIMGSHGRTGEDRRAVFASTIPFDNMPGSLVELAAQTRTWLDNNS